MAATERLSGTDAGFLFIESDSQSSTCVDLYVLAAPPPGGLPLTVQDLKCHLADRLPRIPPLRWRLQRVPGGVNHPVWVPDAGFDLDHHVGSLSVAAPGGEAELNAVAAAALPHLLDLSRPPWKVELVDGLADGRQALLFSFHHSLADGAALITILGDLLGDGRADLPAAYPRPHRRPPTAPPSSSAAWPPTSGPGWRCPSSSFGWLGGSARSSGGRRWPPR